MSRKPFVLLYLLLVPLCGYLVSGVTDISTLYNLDIRGEQTQGTVLALDCSNHLSVEFSMTVNGVEYFGKGGVGNCASRFVGDVVTVVYDASDPSVYTMGNPSSALRDAIFGVAIGSFVMPLIFVLALMRRIEKDRSSQAPRSD